MYCYWRLKYYITTTTTTTTTTTATTNNKYYNNNVKLNAELRNLYIYIMGCAVIWAAR